MLLQQRQRQAIDLREVLTPLLLPDPRLILAISHIHAPMATFFDAPVSPDRVRESLHVDLKSADIRTDLICRFPISDAIREHHTDRLHALPELEPRNTCWYSHLNVSASLFTSVRPLADLKPTRLDVGVIVLPLLLNRLIDSMTA